MSEWQPIETAPKDGTAILIFKMAERRRSFWMPPDKLFPGEGSYQTDDPRLAIYDDWRFAIGYWRPWGGWGDRNNATVEPISWMPLPEPPR